MEECQVGVHSPLQETHLRGKLVLLCSGEGAKEEQIVHCVIRVEPELTPHKSPPSVHVVSLGSPSCVLALMRINRIVYEVDKLLL